MTSTSETEQSIPGEYYMVLKPRIDGLTDLSNHASRVEIMPARAGIPRWMIVAQNQDPDIFITQPLGQKLEIQTDMRFCSNYNLNQIPSLRVP